MKGIFLLLYIVIFMNADPLFGQCNPPASSDCTSAPLLCGLNELDGLSCQTSSTSNPTGPDPLCNGSGTRENTQWWTFKGNGQQMTIAFSFDLANCTDNKGIEAGVLDDCGGMGLDCNIDCNTSSFSLSFASENCKSYYLWIDGCEGVVCDYDIQITNGEAPQLPSNLPKPASTSSKCPGIFYGVCVERIGNQCADVKLDWTVDGAEYPSLSDEYCIEPKFPKDASPSEICVTFTIGDGSIVCDQKTTCTTFYEGPPIEIDEGEEIVCWESHQNRGFEWRDTFIYTNCINPPCTSYDRTPKGCLIKYTKAFTLLPERTIQEVFQFVCDKEDLPYLTEDGQRFYEGVCSEEIVWSDPNYYDCDTTYILNLEVFNPEVNIRKSCPNCNNEITLEIEIDYFPDCSAGETNWIVYWRNNKGDTVGVGDAITVKDSGSYYVELGVIHNNFITGETKTCVVQDSSWWIDIAPDTLSIRGDSMICVSDTGTYALPEIYDAACDILWTIEGVHGEIITPNNDKKAKIEVVWSSSTRKSGQICAEIENGCDTVKKVCLPLRECIITAASRYMEYTISIYPNPAFDFIHIVGRDLNEMKMRLLDIRGNEIAASPQNITDTHMAIDVSALSSAVYFLEVTSGEKTRMYKVLVL